MILNRIMSNTKISIRFFNDREVRAVWDEENAKWWFSAKDILALSIIDFTNILYPDVHRDYPLPLASANGFKEYKNQLGFSPE